MTLEIKDLHVKIKENDQEIIKGLDLFIPDGEVHALMGPNGNGKSTLAQTIMGYHAYEVTSGEIVFNGRNLLDLTVDERARLGLFMGMQYPAEITGINNADFLRAAVDACSSEPISVFDFMERLDSALKFLEMPEDMTERYLNAGFSGGEKKRNEILQLLMIQPKFAILDEIDSGLDIDALRIVANGINKMRDDKFSALMITHYERLLEYVTPDVIHIIVDGRVVESGGPELADKLEQSGYQEFKEIN